MIESSYDMIANDAILPSQLTQNADTPEKRLKAAVLKDAVRLFTQGPRISAKSRKDYREAIEWLFVTSDEDHRWTFSFEGICDALAINASWLRTGLRVYEENRPIPRRPPVIGFQRYAVEAIRYDRKNAK